MKPFCLAVILGALVSAGVLAGPNAGGVLALHDPDSVFTVDTSNYCNLGAAPDSCEGIDSNVEASGPDNPRVWKVYALFPDTAAPRLKGLTFGISYPPDSVTIVAYGPCIGDLNNGAAELTGAGWPENDSGTSIVFQDVQTTRVVECYWFAGYAYSGVPTRFMLRDNPDPILGGTFGDDGVPAVLDEIADYGTLGFGRTGRVPCADHSPGGMDNGGPGWPGGEDEESGEVKAVHQ